MVLLYYGSWHRVLCSGPNWTRLDTVLVLVCDPWASTGGPPRQGADCPSLGPWLGNPLEASLSFTPPAEGAITSRTLYHHTIAGKKKIEMLTTDIYNLIIGNISYVTVKLVRIRDSPHPPTDPPYRSRPIRFRAGPSAPVMSSQTTGSGCRHSGVRR